VTLSSVVIAVGIFVIVSIVALYLGSAIANTGLESEQRKRMAALARNPRWEKIASVVFGTRERDIVVIYGRHRMGALFRRAYGTSSASSGGAPVWAT
jgi:uncharacterized DUF497 family protein